MVCYYKIYSYLCSLISYIYITPTVHVFTSFVYILFCYIIYYSSYFLLPHRKLIFELKGSLYAHAPQFLDEQLGSIR